MHGLGLVSTGILFGYLYNRDDGKLWGHPRCTRAQYSEHESVADSLNPKPLNPKLNSSDRKRVAKKDDWGGIAPEP